MSIKKYTTLREGQSTRTFDIKRMEDVYDLQNGTPDEPHRHDYYIILIVEQAKGQHIIDFQSFRLNGNQIYFLSPGQIHQMVEKQRSKGWIITFSKEFLIQNKIDNSLLESLYIFQDLGESPPLIVDDIELSELSQIASALNDTLNSNTNFKYLALGALLTLLFVRSNNLCTLQKEDHPQKIDSKQRIYKEFRDKLEQDFRIAHKVMHYANQLNVTSDHLNTTIRSLVGKTAKEHIQDRIIVESKRLLIFGDNTIKEIAYMLGFNDPANFSQFFKKCQGISPTQWIKNNQ